MCKKQINFLKGVRVKRRVWCRPVALPLPRRRPLDLKMGWGMVYIIYCILYIVQLVVHIVQLVENGKTEKLAQFLKD